MAEIESNYDNLHKYSIIDVIKKKIKINFYKYWNKIIWILLWNQSNWRKFSAQVPWQASWLSFRHQLIDLFRWKFPFCVKKCITHIIKSSKLLYWGFLPCATKWKNYYYEILQVASLRISVSRHNGELTLWDPSSSFIENFSFASQQRKRGKQIYWKIWFRNRNVVTR